MLELNMRERRRYLLQMATNLELLEFDIEHGNPEWKTVRLVDFAAIHAFVYGGGADSEKVDGSIELLEAHRFARQQVALGLIFSGQPSPLGLLPSYASELANHIRRIRSDSALIQHLLSRGTERRARLGNFLENNIEFQEFHRKHKSGEASVQDAIALAQRSFPELLAMVRIASGDVLGTLARLLRDNLITDAKTLLPQQALVEVPQLLVDRWYEEILEQRSFDRQYASMIDALACSYLEAAQPALSAARINIQFITPSTIIGRVMRDRQSEERKSPVRSYDYFLLAMAFDSRREQIPLIKRQVDDLYRVYERISRPDEADKWLDGAERIWKEVENLSVLQDNEFSSALRQSTRNGKFERIIYHLALAASDHPEAFDEQAMAVVTGFQRELELFRNLLPEERAAESIRGFLAVYETRKQWMILPSLDNDFPLALRFKAGSIHEYAKYLSRLPDEHSRNDLRAAAANISAQVIQEAHEERYLFAGYLAGLAGRHVGAILMLNTGIASASQDIKLEYLYLLAVIYRQRHEYAEAETALDAASAINPNDPRLLLELASIHWIKNYHTYQSGSAGYVEAINHSIALALRASSESTRSSRSSAKVVQMHAENTLAFLFIELALGSPEDDCLALLEKAEARMVILREIWPETDWSGRVLDTRGWMSYARAKLLRPENRAELLSSARIDIEQALSAEAFDRRRKLLESHLNAVEAEQRTAL
jgi:hypothetical protein